MKDFIEGEVWKDVAGYKGKYKISSLGRLYSLPRKRKNGDVSDGRLIKYSVLSGYYQTSLYNKNNNIGKSIRVHRLVANTFIPNPENKPFIDHIDGDRKNNCIDNLRWCTNRENINYDNVNRSILSGIKGVRLTKHNSYINEIRYDGVAYRSKRFKNANDAKVDYEHKMDFIKAYESAILMNIL